MEQLEIVFGLFVMLVVVATLARRIDVPYPILLVLGGLVIGLLPGLPRGELDPELVLLVFLPPLLYAAAIATPVGELRVNLQPISLLASGLVLTTIAVVAVAAHLGHSGELAGRLHPWRDRVAARPSGGHRHRQQGGVARPPGHHPGSRGPLQRTEAASGRLGSVQFPWCAGRLVGGLSLQGQEPSMLAGAHRTLRIVTHRQHATELAEAIGTLPSMRRRRTWARSVHRLLEAVSRRAPARWQYSHPYWDFPPLTRREVVWACRAGTAGDRGCAWR